MATTGLTARGMGEYDNSRVSVNFPQDADGLGEVEEERKKYLTAKYGQHQMKLIRKRLAVEDWLDKALTSLYDVTSETSTYDCDIDLDDLLDLEDDLCRRKFLQEKISNARKPPEIKTKFISDVLEKAKTL